MINSTKIDIINQTNSLINFNNTNLEQIKNSVGGLQGEVINYYLGLIRRQTVLICDIKNILEADNHHSYIRIYIICRCIIDDYIRLKHIINDPNLDESIIALNADARKKNFDNLFSMAEINEQYIHKEPPYYPTIDLVNQLKEYLLSQPWMDKYFTDKPSFKFKKFPTTRYIVDNFPENEKASMFRSFYLWKHFSDYIHYSSVSADLEMSETSNCFNFIQETVYHSYKTSLFALNYFKTLCGSKILDMENLEYFYSNAEEL